MIRQDILHWMNRIGGGRAIRFVETVRSPGVQAVVIYRFGHWLLSQNLLVKSILSPLYFFLYHRMRRWGIEIMRHATIGEGFVVQHHGAVFVGADVVAGKNFVIHQDVSLGLLLSGPRRGSPVFGDDVVLAPGVRVFGKVRVGSNVRIGPNCVVLNDVPDNAVVSLPPMKTVVFPSRSERERESETAE